MDKILLSKENVISILKAYMENIDSKISSKDISTPYIDKLNLADKIKVDGEGNLFLFDNGEYIKLDISKLNITKENIDTIYKLFNINTQEESWSTKLSMPTSRYYLTSCIYQNKIYVIGGYEGSNKNECYDIATNTWSTKADMLTGRYGLISNIYKNKIYVFGGYVNKNECYDIATDTWSTKADMLTSRRYLTSSIYENKIYCIGGNGASNINECYDIATDTWSTKASMLTGRYYLTSCIYQNKIYCIGGCGLNGNPLSHNECYDITTDTWYTKTSMLTGRYGLTSSIYKDKIYCIGGNAGNINECYDIATDTWSTKADMLTSRRNLTSSIYENKIYCIGGDVNKNEVYSISYTDYDITLPDSIQTKLDIIKEDGDGSKVLADNGAYIDISPIFDIIQDSDIEDIMNQI